MSISDSLAKTWIRDRHVRVTLYHNDADWPGIDITAKVDTGADRCSIDIELAYALGWEVGGERTIKNANGKQRREYGSGVIEVDGEEFLMCATFTDRSKLSHPVLIGHDLLVELLDLSEEE